MLVRSLLKHWFNVKTSKNLRWSLISLFIFVGDIDPLDPHGQIVGDFPRGFPRFSRSASWIPDESQCYPGFGLFDTIQNDFTSDRVNTTHKISCQALEKGKKKDGISGLTQHLMGFLLGNMRMNGFGFGDAIFLDQAKM